MNDVLKNNIPHISAELIPTSFIIIELLPKPEITYLNQEAISLFKANSFEGFYKVYRANFLKLIYKEDISTVLYNIKHGLKRAEKLIKLDCRICALDGSHPFVNVQIHPVYEEGESCKTLYITLYNDTENHILIQKYLNESSTDSLTGLLNREGLMRKFKTDYKSSVSEFFVIILDMDNFKAENDSSGHDFGDVILKSVAELIKNLFKKNSLISRYGGDEFVIITDSSESEIKNSLSSLLKKITEIGELAKNGVALGASLGVAKNGSDGTALNTLLKNADKALYYSKSHGKNRFTFYGDIKSTGEEEYKNSLMRGTRLTPIDLINNEKIRKLMKLLDTICLNQKNSDRATRILKSLNEIYGCKRSYIYSLSDDKIPDKLLYSHPSDTLSLCIKPHGRNNIFKDIYMRCASRFTPEGLYICENLSFLSESEAAFLKELGTESFMWILLNSSSNKNFMLLGLDFSENPIGLSRMDLTTLPVLSKLIGYNLDINYDNIFLDN